MLKGNAIVGQSGGPTSVINASLAGVVDGAVEAPGPAAAGAGEAGAFGGLDQFGAVAYNNNNGTNNWASSWDETGDNDSADSGDILVTSNRLQFDYTLIGSVDATDNIVRQVSIPVGGGVTASGGEILAQADFVAEQPARPVFGNDAHPHFRGRTHQITQ